MTAGTSFRSGRPMAAPSSGPPKPSVSAISSSARPTPAPRRDRCLSTRASSTHARPTRRTGHSQPEARPRRRPRDSSTVRPAVELERARDAPTAEAYPAHRPSCTGTARSPGHTPLRISSSRRSARAPVPRPSSIEHLDLPAVSNARPGQFVHPRLRDLAAGHELVAGQGHPPARLRCLSPCHRRVPGELSREP